MDRSGFAYYPSPDPSSGPTSPQTNILASSPGSNSERPSQPVITPSPTQTEESEDDATVSISFTPSLRFDDCLPDAVIVSSDHVHFYVHRRRIIDASSNAFDGQFCRRQSVSGGFMQTINVSESGDVVNVLLHTVYGLSCLHYGPSLETINTALVALSKYGVPVESQASPEQPLYFLVLSHAPYFPIETYALAAHHGLEDIAVAASAHLHTFDISGLSDELAVAMGPLYLKRLVLLHKDRLSALRNILIKVPDTHPNLPHCSEYEQSRVTREWVLATAQLLWDIAPNEVAVATSPVSAPTADESSRQDWLSLIGIPADTLGAHLERAGEAVVCQWCRQMLAGRIQDAVYTWSMVKPTI